MSYQRQQIRWSLCKAVSQLLVVRHQMSHVDLQKMALEHSVLTQLVTGEKWAKRKKGEYRLCPGHSRVQGGWGSRSGSLPVDVDAVDVELLNEGIEQLLDPVHRDLLLVGLRGQHLGSVDPSCVPVSHVRVLLRRMK